MARIMLPTSATRPRRSLSWKIVFLLVVGVSFLLFQPRLSRRGRTVRSPPRRLRQSPRWMVDKNYKPPQETEFNWWLIEPSADLEWHGCFAGHTKCARLSVPLDWFNGTMRGETASIAIVKVPAQVPVNDTRYNGPVLINPGGPGGSGTLFAAFGGLDVQVMVDTRERDGASADEARYHDVIGFDPRGVAFTTPGAQCFDDARGAWFTRVFEEGLPGSSDAALGRLLSMHRAFGATCDERSTAGGGEGWALNYSSTAFVARDMLQIVAKEREWRERELDRLRRAASDDRERVEVVGDIFDDEPFYIRIAWRVWVWLGLNGSGHIRIADRDLPSRPLTDEENRRLDEKMSMSRATDPKDLELEDSSAKPDEPPVKLNFWGLSYGTLLGATFASMFPDNVGRMILDGVLEPSDFVNHHWTGSVEDTEAAMQAFYDACAAAGPPPEIDRPFWGCPMARNGSTSADVRERVQSILSELYHNPFWYVIYPYGHGSAADRANWPPAPTIITYSDVKAMFFSSFYQPASFWTMAELLYEIERGERERVADIMAANAPSSPEPFGDMSDAELPGDSGLVVECSDSDPFTDISLDQWQHTVREMESFSPAGGPLLAGLHLRCAGWAATPGRKRPHRFAGPFGGDTATPILWIGNTADPICPLKSAVNQARRFKNSVVLQHDAIGHCSLAAYSPCTAAAIRAYFRNATLPAAGTVCPTHQTLFRKHWTTEAPSSDNPILHVQPGVYVPADAAEHALVCAHDAASDLFHAAALGYGMPRRQRLLPPSLAASARRRPDDHEYDYDGDLRPYPRRPYPIRESADRTACLSPFGDGWDVSPRHRLRRRSREDGGGVEVTMCRDRGNGDGRRGAEGGGAVMSAVHGRGDGQWEFGGPGWTLSRGTHWRDGWAWESGSGGE